MRGNLRSMSILFVALACISELDSLNVLTLNSSCGDIFSACLLCWKHWTWFVNLWIRWFEVQCHVWMWNFASFATGGMDA